MTLPSIAESCQQLTNCGYKTECRDSCKCYQFGLSCTALHSVAADVNISVRKWTCLILNLRWWTLMIYGLQANDVLSVITFEV